MKGGEAGFTLIEMVVALALFALISVAALSLIETVLNAQRRTEGRLERLAAIDRAMHLVDRDFTALSDGPLLTGDAVSFRRNAVRGSALIGYAEGGGALLPGVGAIAWRFHRAGQWLDTPGTDKDPRPDAIALTVTLTTGGTLRRVVALPVAP